MISQADLVRIDSLIKDRFFGQNRVKRFEALLRGETDSETQEQLATQMLVDDFQEIRKAFFAAIVQTLQSQKA